LAQTPGVDGTVFSSPSANDAVPGPGDTPRMCMNVDDAGCDPLTTGVDFSIASGIGQIHTHCFDAIVTHCHSGGIQANTGAGQCCGCAASAARWPLADG